MLHGRIRFDRSRFAPEMLAQNLFALVLFWFNTLCQLDWLRVFDLYHVGLVSLGLQGYILLGHHHISLVDLLSSDIGCGVDRL